MKTRRRNAELGLLRNVMHEPGYPPPLYWLAHRARLFLVLSPLMPLWPPKSGP